MNFKEFFIKRKSPLFFGTPLPETKKLVGLGGDSIEASQFFTDDEFLELVQRAIEEGALKDQNGNPILSGGGTADFSTVVTTTPYTIDGVTYPTGTPLATIATAIITAEAANGEFQGVYGNLSALTTNVTNPTAGDLAFVLDTNGMGGGEQSVSGFARYSGSSWIVFKLFEKAAKLVNDLDLSAINSSHVQNEPQTLDVQSWATSNNLKNVYISYMGTMGNLHDPLYVYYVDKDGFVTNIKAKSPIYNIPRQFVTGPQITGLGGDPKFPTPAVMLNVRNTLYPNSVPGTIFYTTAASATQNQGYNDNNPPFVFFYDGQNMTLIKGIPISLNLQATSTGSLGGITVTPLVPSGSVPTPSEIATWLNNNFTTNGVVIPNGSTVYWVGNGTNDNPDYIWIVLDDVTYTPSGSGSPFIVEVKKPSQATSVTETVNGARITYQVLSGTPTLTYDKSNPLTPTLTVSGGTIKLFCVKDHFSTTTSVNPVFTFNATWQDAMDARPVSVLKIVEGSDMLDVDNTPQVINNVNSTTQSVVTINAVDSNYTFIFTWVH